MAEVIEEVVEEAGRQFDTRALGFFAAGVGLGCVIGYVIGEKRAEARAEKYVTEQIDEMREHFRDRMRETDKFVSGSKPSLDRIVEDLGYKAGGDDPNPTRYSEVEQAAIDEVEEATAESEPQEEKHNVFTEGGWDYAVETKARVEGLPYVIHIDEYQQNEGDYEQISYTYYEDDQVLADERDGIVDNLEQTIGFANIRFGHGSNDPMVVYVRNDQLHLDYEIVKDEGSYGEKVHGIIEHSATTRVRRPVRRFDDE